MSWLSRLFKPKEIQNDNENINSEPQIQLGPNDLFFHEDFYCQVQIVPSENLQNLKAENKNIEDFSEQNRSGVGYDDIYLRESEDIKIAIRKITIAEFDSLLEECGFKKMDSVYTGYGATFKELCENTNAYVLDDSEVFCEYGDNTVENIWIDNFRFKGDSIHIENYITVLNAFGTKWNLILNDWNLTETVNLDNRGAIETYIRDL